MIAAGRVSGLFGAKGEVTLVLFDFFPRDPDTEEPVFVKIDGHKVPLFFEKFARRGMRGATALFADIDTAERASELVGLELSIDDGADKGKSLSGTAGSGDGDELYFEDLMGWDVEVDTGQAGRITAFYDSEFNPLLEIELDGGRNDLPPATHISVAGRPGTVGGNNVGGERVLVPAQEEFIVEVDERRRKIVFSLPEGLLDVNK